MQKAIKFWKESAEKMRQYKKNKEKV